MKIQNDLIIRPFCIQFIFGSEPVSFKIYITITVLPLSFFQLHCKEFVIEDEQHFQLRITFKVIIYFIYDCTHILFLNFPTILLIACVWILRIGHFQITSINQYIYIFFSIFRMVCYTYSVKYFPAATRYVTVIDNIFLFVVQFKVLLSV